MISFCHPSEISFSNACTFCSIRQAEVTLYARVVSYPDQIEEDKCIPNNIILSHHHCIRTARGDNFTNSQILAGDNHRSGDAVGENARFYWPRGFILITRSQVIISDTRNHCLKLLDRHTGFTNRVAGSCSIAGYEDGAGDAKFDRPWTIRQDNQNSSQLLMSENNNFAIRTVAVCHQKWLVGTFVKSDQLVYVRQFMQDAKGNIFASAKNAIFYISYQQRAVSLLIGSTASGFKDGSFLEARFRAPHGQQWISPTSFLVSDISNSKIRLADLESRTVSTLDLCNSALCSDIYDPVSFLLTSSVFYLGEYEKILRFECKYATKSAILTNKGKSESN